MAQEVYRAIVEKVVSNGEHGPYAVARHPELGSVTFSLLPDVWQEGDIPERGMEVNMTRLRKKRGGWRAMSVSYVQPEQHSAGSKQQ